MSALKQLTARIALAGITLFAVATFVYFVTNVIPGDAATQALGRDASPEMLEQYRVQFGLNRPVVERYLVWVNGLAKGDFGVSLPSGQPVATLLAPKIMNTALLTLMSLAVMIPISLVIGIYCAINRGGILDSAVTAISTLLIALPEFVIAAVLIIIFALWLNLLPAISMVDLSASVLDNVRLMILPVFTVVLALAPIAIRMTRANMIDVLNSDYVSLARLKGVQEWRVIVFHALPNAIGPISQVIAQLSGYMAGGLVVVESIFAFPGLGQALALAISARDVSLVAVAVTILCCVYIAANLVADLIATLANPRLRLK